MITETIYTVKEVAEMFRVSHDTITRLIKAEKMGATLFNTSYRISEEQLNEYLEKYSVKQNKSY